jgi:hypothetical protein
MNRITLLLADARLVLAVLLTCFTAWTPAQAFLLIKHEGATDPLTEGFPAASSAFGQTFTTNALTPDGSTGFNAWEIKSDSPYVGGGGLSSFAVYIHNWSPSELASISTLPRLVQMRLRVVDPNDVVDSGMQAGWSFGGKEYYVGFGSAANGDPIVGLGSTFTSYPQQYTVTGAAGQYVLYELKDYDADGTFRLFANGFDTGLNTSGASSSQNRVFFGDGDASAGAFGHANWNLLLIDVPEPTSAALAGLGLLVLLRKRRSTVFGGR